METRRVLILAAAAMMACFLLLDISGVQPESAMNLRGSFSELLEAEEADLADEAAPEGHGRRLGSLRKTWKAIKQPFYVYGPGGTGDAGYAIKQEYKKHMRRSRKTKKDINYVGKKKISRAEWRALGDWHMTNTKGFDYLVNPEYIAKGVKSLRMGTIGHSPYPWEADPKLMGR